MPEYVKSSTVAVDEFLQLKLLSGDLAMQKSITGSGSEAKAAMMKSKTTNRTATLLIIVSEWNLTIFCSINIWKVVSKRIGWLFWLKLSTHWWLKLLSWGESSGLRSHNWRLFFSICLINYWALHQFIRVHIFFGNFALEKREDTLISWII